MDSVFFHKYQNRLSVKNKLGRFLWGMCFRCMFRPFSLPLFNPWRLFILRCFGAKIRAGSKIHASVKIWAPWNLDVGHYTVIGPTAEIYNPGKIILGNKVTISQRAYLCAASHDYTKKEHPLITAPIMVHDYAWVAVDAFVSMGITIGEGAIVGARAVVVKDVAPWSIVGGNPAKFIKRRELNG